MPAKHSSCSRLRRTRTSLLALVLAAGLAAQAHAEIRDVDVPPGPMEKALLTLARQTGQQLLYAPDLVAGRRTAGLSGRYSAEEALAKLLADEALVVTRVGPNALTLKRRTSAGQEDKANPERPFGDDAPAVAAEPARAFVAPSAPTTVEEVRVTGSNIRGVAPGPSPLVAITAEDLQRSGRATVAEVLQALPQNYSGETSENLVTTRSDRVGTNTTFASGVNLRGLGSDATLVLVNGRRVAGSGSRGDFSDVSGIPNAAIERVEVLVDGASAVYGSDAVGGVVNIILREDFDGVELRLRGGAGARAEPTEAQLGLLAGRTWAGGGVLASYESYLRSHLDASERAFTRSSDLRPLGGSDRRETLSFPGNILRTDPATGVTIPFYGIPAGQDGTALTPADFPAGMLNRQNQNLGIDIVPEQRRQSLYVAAHQDLGARLSLLADFRYALREAKAESAIPTATLTVNRNNPFFVSPTGAASHQIQYSFAGLLPNPRAETLARTLTGTLGGRFDLGATWAAEGYLAYASSTDKQRLNGVLNTLILNEALGVVADNPGTAFSARTNGFLNPFSGQPNAPLAVRAAIGSGFTQNRVRNDIYTASLQADGVAFVLPGGEVRMALGAQGRRETYDRSGINYTGTATPAPQSGLSADRSVAATFAEVRAPLVGDENARPAVRSLDLTGAIRYERYSDFGETVNPKVGLLWSPASGVRLRATYSESYRAPALQELRDQAIFVPIRRTLGAGRLLTLTLNGGNPDLGPETAETWSAGIDLQPSQLAGLRVSATWFRTDFDNRIDRPVLSNSAGVLSDPRLAPFVRRISPGTNPADLALIEALLADPATTTALGVFPATEYGAIIDARYINTSRLQVEGVDVQATYATDAFGGRLTLSALASWLYDYVQQITPTDTAVDLSGVFGNPPRFRSRLSADWARGRVGAGLALNQQSDQRDRAGVKIGGPRTVDLNLRLDGAPGTAFADTRLLLTVRNLLDEDPPFYDNPAAFGFDPATGDPIGRFVALQLTRRW